MNKEDFDMGMEYYNCKRCGKIFSDYGDYRMCDECENRWCGQDCAEKDGYQYKEWTDDKGEDWESHSCGHCRGEIEEEVTIKLSEYNELLKSANKLSALECAGVDNWDGYSYAMSEFYEGEDDDEEVK